MADVNEMAGGRQPDAAEAQAAGGDPRSWRIRHDSVMSEVLDGEAVIVDLQSGRYHAAVDVAATVWTAVGRGVSFDEIVIEVRRRHLDAPADAADQVRAFLAELVDQGLVAPVEAGTDGVADALDVTDVEAPVATTPWRPPALESHDDLEDLLLLDPVHDVTAGGWPNAAPTP